MHPSCWSLERRWVAWIEDNGVHPGKPNGWKPQNIGGLSRRFSFSFWGYFQVQKPLVFGGRTSGGWGETQKKLATVSMEITCFSPLSDEQRVGTRVGRIEHQPGDFGVVFFFWNFTFRFVSRRSIFDIWIVVSLDEVYQWSHSQVEQAYRPYEFPGVPKQLKKV